MKTCLSSLLLLVLSAGVCAGQDGLDTVQTACNAMEPATRAKTEACQYIAKQPAPLKCGKYEHEEHIEGYCHSATCKGNFACPAIAVCDPPVDRCAPDLHTVTEKEWQELMGRLKRLKAR